jgi:CRISPR-associated protein Cas1
MESVYIMEPGSFIRKNGGEFSIVKNGAVLNTIPSSNIKRVVLAKGVSLTSAVLDYFVDNKIETVFLTRNGKFRARISTDENSKVELRKNQYFLLSDSVYSKKFACAVVNGKIKNMSNFMALRGRDYNDRQLSEAGLALKSFKPVYTDSMDKIRGLEGAASALYFRMFKKMIKNNDFTFEKRSKRPPLDPINAMLSYIYTIILSEVLTAIQIKGLDPYLGALHEILHSRPSLACDLVEEYRAPVADRFVLELVNRKIVKKDDFVFRDIKNAYADEKDMAQNRPVEMKPKFRNKFIESYEYMMNTGLFYPPENKKMEIRKIITRQISQFIESLENKTTYKPFEWKR